MAGRLRAGPWTNGSSVRRRSAPPISHDPRRPPDPRLGVHRRGVRQARRPCRIAGGGAGVRRARAPVGCRRRAPAARRARRGRPAARARQRPRRLARRAWPARGLHGRHRSRDGPWRSARLPLLRHAPLRAGRPADAGAQRTARGDRGRSAGGAPPRPEPVGLDRRARHDADLAPRGARPARRGPGRTVGVPAGAAASERPDPEPPGRAGAHRRRSLGGRPRVGRRPLRPPGRRSGAPVRASRHRRPAGDARGAPRPRPPGAPALHRPGLWPVRGASARDRALAARALRPAHRRGGVARWRGGQPRQGRGARRDPRAAADRP